MSTALSQNKTTPFVILNSVQDSYGSTDARLNAWMLKQVQYDNTRKNGLLPSGGEESL